MLTNSFFSADFGKSRAPLPIAISRHSLPTRPTGRVLVEAGTGPEFYGLPDPKGKSYYHFLEIKAMFTKNNIRPGRCIFETFG
jgi:hypothetical protein